MVPVLTNLSPGLLCKWYCTSSFCSLQVLKTSGPAKSASKEKIVYPVPADPLPSAQRKLGSVSEAGAGAAASAFAVAVTATKTTPGIAPAAASEEDGILVEPPEEEVWFEDSRGGQAGGGTTNGTVSASSSSLLAPVEETMVRSAAPGELLYEPPNWGGTGGGGGGGASRSRQGSDASASAAASVRGMFNYIRSKAAAVVTTPTASDAATGGSGSFFASSGGGKLSRRGSRQSNGGGDAGSHYASSGGGGSMPSTPGFPSVDEGLAPAGLPPAEMWAGTRDDPGNAAAFAAAHSAARDVSDAAQSTAHAFLSMVKPSYWRTDSEGGGGDAAGESPVGFGDGRGGERGSSDRWVSVPGGAGSFDDTVATGSMLESLGELAAVLCPVIRFCLSNNTLRGRTWVGRLLFVSKVGMFRWCLPLSICKERCSKRKNNMSTLP